MRENTSKWFIVVISGEYLITLIKMFNSCPEVSDAAWKLLWDIIPQKKDRYPQEIPGGAGDYFYYCEMVRRSTGNRWQKGLGGTFRESHPSRASVTAPVRDTDRFILGSAFELTADDQGRVVIPESLALYAGLSQKVVFLGLRDRVELWDEAVWLKKESEIASRAAELIEKLAEKNDKK